MESYQPGQKLAFGNDLAQYEILDETLFVKCDSDEVAATVRDALATVPTDVVFLEFSDNLPFIRHPDRTASNDRRLTFLIGWNVDTKDL